MRSEIEEIRNVPPNEERVSKELMLSSKPGRIAEKKRSDVAEKFGRKEMRIHNIFTHVL